MVFFAVLIAVLVEANDPNPLWEPVWQLNRSTAANVCNRSDYIDLLPGTFALLPGPDQYKRT